MECLLFFKTFCTILALVLLQLCTPHIINMNHSIIMFLFNFSQHHFTLRTPSRALNDPSTQMRCNSGCRGACMSAASRAWFLSFLFSVQILFWFCYSKATNVKLSKRHNFFHSHRGSKGWYVILC